MDMRIDARVSETSPAQKSIIDNCERRGHCNEVLLEELRQVATRDQRLPWLVQTTSRDPSIIGSIAAILALVAVAASIRPARAATQLDPLVALRHEQ
jgi:hypothetical protein